jgi:hypothetical protein
LNQYIKDFTSVISNCAFDNTYKMAWAKALVELSNEIEITNERTVIDFDSISKKFMKFYFNQTIFFNLTQGSNLRKPPEILSITKNIIDKVLEARDSRVPIRFEKVEALLNNYDLRDEYVRSIKRISQILKKDVSYRFLNIGKSIVKLYELDIKQQCIYINEDDIRALKDYSEVLFQIINYRWTQMLETFNTSPKIAKKVRATHEIDGIRRKPLTGFRKFLDLLEDGPRMCFFCGSEIKDDELSIDHVIPWSFMFSDDIWNLVYCHKGENSSKSNLVVDEKIILKLEKRNIQLLDRLIADGINNKVQDELQLAIEHNYVRKFWLSAKG